MCWFCGHETRIFKVTRSESVIQHIINAERYFWDCVEKDVPPEADASHSASKALQQLYPEHVPLSTTDLSTDENANQQFEQLIQAHQQIEKHQQQFDLLKHERHKHYDLTFPKQAHFTVGRLGKLISG